ncbi:hypothetical protein AVEN_18068-1 [Araneus ventricosus]|uniref:Uncharacterized protein n=1 Tax=Araneus ventricosus TaxID=182803 RepID=A0A4Y2UHU1_ARAVE|nr:hypothetical protein AVEN_18068-1 [Araneus ventricosus]
MNMLVNAGIRTTTTTCYTKIDRTRSLLHPFSFIESLSLMTWMNMMVQMGLELPPQLAIPLDETEPAHFSILSPLSLESFPQDLDEYDGPNGIVTTATTFFTTR